MSRIQNSLKTGWVVFAAAMLMPAIAVRALEIEEASVADLQAAYKDHRLTVRQVVEAHLARIAAYDKQGPIINSLVTVNGKALAEADAQDAWLSSHPGKLNGSLFGIPVIVKDNIDVAGMPMTSGFQGWKNYFPPTDAPLAAKIKAAGGIIIGKASLSEFARGGGDNINSVVSGFARNPYNTAYATGGSSGGTAAGLASSFGVVGIGTDTGGSVRMPSAHNALVGLRPTVGLVSRTGVVPLDSNRDTAGPMARSVRDMAVLLDVIVGPDAQDAATARSKGHIAVSYQAFLKKDGLQGVRLGVLRQVFNSKVTDPLIVAHFEKTLAELRAQGAEIIDPITVPELDTIPRPPQTAARFKHDLTQFIAKHPGIPYPSVQAIADSKLVHPLHQQGMEQAAAALPQDQDPATLEGAKNEALLREAFLKAMNAANVEALVFPTWAQLPALNGDRNTQIADDPQPAPNAAPTHLGSTLTYVGSFLQWPAISVPNGYLGEGLPVGLQILSRPWDEAKLVQYAYAYEQATRYRRPPPSVPPLTATSADATPAPTLTLPRSRGGGNESALADRLIGTWKLIAIRDREAATGKETPAAKAADSGQLVYAANGRLSVQIVRVGRDSLPANSSEGFSSYFGRWELLPTEGCVVHHQDGNLNAAQVGQAAKRYYSFDEAGHLSLATPPRKREDGAPVSSVFVWEKML